MAERRVLAFTLQRTGVGAYDHGMTLRDYFAGQVASGDATDGEGIEDDDAELLERARYYYRMADAMLAVRDE